MAIWTPMLRGQSRRHKNVTYAFPEENGCEIGLEPAIVKLEPLYEHLASCCSTIDNGSYTQVHF